MPDFQFNSFAEFVAMSGYGFFVWSAYAFFAVVLAINLWLPYRRRAELLKLLQARQVRQQEANFQAGNNGQSSQQ